MSDLDSIIKALREYFSQKPILRAWIFGSYARGEQTPSSDIDILVDFDDQNYPSLLSHVAMINSLEDIIGHKIDLVPNDCLYESIRPAVNKEKILIYERP